MTDTKQAGLLDTAINILVSPSEAFEQIRQRPTKLFPLALIVVSTVIALVWYFNIIDFAWYVDDTLANANIDENNIDDARDAMLSMSQNTFMLFGVLGGSLGTVVYYVLQSAYLALISALTGDGQKFSRWFSLVCWTALPSLLAITGMLVTIALSPNGQLSAFDLNPLTLRNLGIETANDSLNTLFASINLTMVWSIGLLTLGYQQWQGSSLGKAIVVIVTPYLLIASVWAYFTLM
jgi:hypothetical protein